MFAFPQGVALRVIESLSQTVSRTLRSWVDWVVRLAWIVIILTAGVTALAVSYSLNNFSINTDTRDMISSEVSFRQNDEVFDAAFPQFEGLLVAVVEGPTAEDSEAAADRLALALSERPQLFDHIRQPGSEVFFKENAFLFLEEPALEALADRLAAAEPLLAALKQDTSLRGLSAVLSQASEGAASLSDPGPLPQVLNAIAEQTDVAGEGIAGTLSWRSLLAADPELVTRRNFVTALPKLDHSSLKPAEKPIAELLRLGNELGITAENGFRLRLTGPAALDHEEFDSIEIGGATAGLVSLCAVAILLIVGLRSVWLVLATLTTLIVGLAWTGAFAMLAIGHLNIISIAFAVLFVGLGVDFGIHFTLRTQEAAASTASRLVALELAAKSTSGALALSALCAAAGFYAFLPTNYKGLAELGLISGTGMFIALFTNLTLLPALLKVLPLPPRQPDKPTPRRGIIESVVLDHGRLVIAAAVVLALVGLVAAPFAQFDFNPLNLKDPETPSVATFLELTEDAQSSPYNIDLLAEDLESAEEKARNLEQLPEVSFALTLSSFIPEEQEAKFDVIDQMTIFLAPLLTPHEETSPPNSIEQAKALTDLQGALERALANGIANADLAAAAAKLATSLEGFLLRAGDSPVALARLEDRLLRHFPAALEDLSLAMDAEEVTLQTLPEELRRDWETVDGVARIEIKPRAGVSDNIQLRKFAEAVLAREPSASGTPIVITEAGKAVVLAFYEASALAFVLILLLLAVVLRRLSDVLLVLAPLGLAAAITTAASVLLDLPFNFANVIVLPLLLGLGVASGIHLVMRRRHEDESRHLLRTSTSRAVMFSALTTIASFGSLIVSGHPGMKSMGELLTIAITSTLICTLVVLPSLMRSLQSTDSSSAT